MGLGGQKAGDRAKEGGVSFLGLCHRSMLFYCSWVFEFHTGICFTVLSLHASKNMIHPRNEIFLIKVRSRLLTVMTCLTRHQFFPPPSLNE